LDALAILCRRIDAVNDWVGRAVSWISFLLVMVVFTDVVMRYLFNTSYVFAQELEWHLFALIFLLASGFTLLKDGHVRVDVVYQGLSPRGQAWVNFLGTVLFLLPGCIGKGSPGGDPSGQVSGGSGSGRLQLSKPSRYRLQPDCLISSAAARTASTILA